MVAPNTNIARFSGDLGNAFWAKHNLAVAPVTIGSPTGHAWRVIATGFEGSGEQYLAEFGLPEFKANRTYTAMVWFKRENWPQDAKVYLFLSNVGQGETIAQSIGQIFVPGDNVQPYFPPLDVSSPALPGWSNVAGGVEYLADGWQRIWVQGTSPNKPGCSFNLLMRTFANERQGDIGSSFIVGGFSLVEGTNIEFADTTTAPRGNDFLPIFDFPYHTVEIRYPVNGTSVAFGNSYNFTAKASGPPQRVFALDFATMVWFIDPYTEQVDPIISAQYNAGALDLFYKLVQLSDYFTYPHPMYGNVECRFNKPLIIPKSLPGGSGATAPLSVELLERPR